MGVNKSIEKLFERQQEALLRSEQVTAEIKELEAERTKLKLELSRLSEDIFKAQFEGLTFEELSANDPLIRELIEAACVKTPPNEAAVELLENWMESFHPGFYPDHIYLDGETLTCTVMLSVDADDDLDELEKKLVKLTEILMRAQSAAELHLSIITSGEATGAPWVLYKDASDAVVMAHDGFKGANTVVNPGGSLTETLRLIQDRRPES